MCEGERWNNCWKSTGGGGGERTVLPAMFFVCGLTYIVQPSYNHKNLKKGKPFRFLILRRFMIWKKKL